jgi:phage protein D/phage baseplate assembly protein gpV
MPANTQQEGIRLARISIKISGSPLAAEKMNDLERAEVDLTLEAPDMATLVFHETNTALTDGTDFEIGNEIEIGFASFTNPTGSVQTIFKGLITNLEPEFEEDFTSRLVVRAYDKRFKLTTAPRSRTFLNKSYSDIVSQIAREAGLTAQATATNTVYEHTFQDNQTDLSFILMLAHRVGYEVAFENDKLVFRKHELGSPVATVEWGVSLRRFLPRLAGTGQVTSVQVRGLIPGKSAPILGESQTPVANTKVGSNASSNNVTRNLGTSHKMILTNVPVATVAEANAIAKAVHTQINAEGLEAEGLCYGEPLIKPGKAISVTKVGQRFSGTYHVTSATHIYDPKEGYNTRFRVEGSQRQFLTSMLENAAPASASVATSSGTQLGFVLALVTNIEDPANKGRVKVKYPTLHDNAESDWAPVVSIGAGPNTGLFWLPEVNDTVLVGFQQGSINYPVVLGGVWSDTQAIPVGSGEIVSGGRVKTRSFKTRGGHELKFVDDGNKAIVLKDMSNNTTIKIDSSSSGDYSVDTLGKIDHKSAGDMKVKSSGKVSMEGASAVEVKSPASITIEANGSVTIKGSGSVTVESSGTLTLKGSTVMIN